MADLQQGQIGFPWQMFMDAQSMKNANQQDMYKNIQGIGSGLGQIGKDVSQYKAKQALMAALAQMRGGPQQGPQMPGVGTSPGQQPPVSGMGAPAPTPNFGQMAVDYSTAFPGQENPMMASFANQFDPLKQAETAHYKAEAAALPATTASNIQHQRAEESNTLLLQNWAREERKRAAEAADFTRNWQIQTGVDKNKAELATKHWIANLMPWSATRKQLGQMKGPLDSPAAGFGGNTGIKNLKVSK